MRVSVQGVSDSQESEKHVTNIKVASRRKADRKRESKGPCALERVWLKPRIARYMPQAQSVRGASQVSDVPVRAANPYNKAGVVQWRHR